MLASIGVFEEASAGAYRNNKLSSCLRIDHRQCVRSMILMHNSNVMSRPWYEQLEQGIRTGQVPFRLAHGEDLFAWMDTHTDFGSLFSKAMDSVDALTGDSYATEFDWRPFNRMIDVGGSRGAKAVAILRRHSHLSALVIDVALRCPTYRHNSHANHTWDSPLRQSACFSVPEAPPVWVRFPSPAPISVVSRWPMLF